MDEPLPPPVVVPQSTVGNHEVLDDEFVIDTCDDPLIELRETAYWLSGTYVVLAAVGCIPAILELVSHFRSEDSPGVERWVFVLLCVTLAQLAYALYLCQLPDWASLTLTSIAAILIASGYALMIGVTITERSESGIVEALQLSRHLPGRRAAAWSFVMMTVTAGLAYVSVRVATRWRRELEGWH